MPSKRELRRRKKANPYVPRRGDYVMAPSYLTNLHPDGEEFEAYVVEVTRPQGVIGATVRFLDALFHKLPDGGMHWYPARDLRFLRGGSSYLSARPEPSRGTLMQSTELHEEETSTTTTGTTQRRRRRRVSSATLKARQHSQKAAAAAESAEVQEEKTSLRKRPRRAKLTAGRTGRSESPTQSQSNRRTTVPTARRTRKAATTEAEPTATTTKRRGRKTAAKPEPEPVKASNGNRRTHEDIVALVPEIVKHLQNGVTMTEIRLGGDTVGEVGYGAGPVIRKALTEAGYNTKGERIEAPDLTELEGKQLANAVAELREDGKAWYYIELATDMSQADLKELLTENGHGDLAEGRVIISGAEEEEEPKPAPKATGRKRGRASKAAEPEPEPEAKPAGRRRGRRAAAANPS